MVKSSRAGAHFDVPRVESRSLSSCPGEQLVVGLYRLRLFQNTIRWVSMISV
jgi:hypothetical protein